MNKSIPAVAAGETFDGTWPFRSRYTNAPGFRMHYVEEGSGPETLLLLHGEPTWSYLFRQQILVWAASHRVIAVDHMGFGKSAAPPDRTYWLQDHIDNLERFVLALELRDLTLVMHDFGGPNPTVGQFRYRQDKWRERDSNLRLWGYEPAGYGLSKLRTETRLSTGELSILDVASTKLTSRR